MRVREEMIEGIRDFLSFYALLGLALEKNSVPILQRTAALNWYGYFIGNKSKDLFLGIYLDNAEYLFLNTEDIALEQRYRDGNEEVTLGELNEDRTTWECKLELSGVDVTTVVDFVRDAVTYARRIVENPSF